MNRAGEGFLGQVILPLRGLVHNLRPVVIQPTGDRPDHGEGDHGGGEGDHGTFGTNDKNKNNNNNNDDDDDDGGGGDDGNSNSNTDTRSGKHGKRDHDHGRGRDRGRDGEIDNGRSACWRSLRGELCGVFPAADRRGRVSAVAAAGAVGRTSPPLRLRLRLSISLDVKNVSTRERERERESERGGRGCDGSRERREGARRTGPNPIVECQARLVVWDRACPACKSARVPLAGCSLRFFLAGGVVPGARLSVGCSCWTARTAVSEARLETAEALPCPWRPVNLGQTGLRRTGAP